MHRVRPQLWQSSAPEFDFAFPSGHAMTSMTLIVILLILSWASPWRWLLFMFGSLYVIAVGWCRLYLGVHFPSDMGPLDGCISLGNWGKSNYQTVFD